MERDPPRPHTPIRTCARQSRRADPEHRIDPARPRVLHCDVAHRLVDAPHVDVRVERTRRTVLPVRGPSERVDPPTVEGPARGDCLCK